MNYHMLAVAVAALLLVPFTTAANSSLVGYLGVFFLGDVPSIYFDLSNGNNAISFDALNGGSPVIVPTLGTGGVRDPAIIAGIGGDSNKWYIVGTDLDISKTTWDASERTGSRGIFVWESTDLLKWTSERLVVVESETAGMVWAPNAIWDTSTTSYMVYWASRFYAASDVNHTGTASPIVMRYAHTSDFKTFTAPANYIATADGSDVIDLNILPLTSANSYVRFIKNETAKYTYSEYTTSGLFGTWTRIGGSGSVIRQSTEGPASFADNTTPGLYHLFLDYYGGTGYAPFSATEANLLTDTWTTDSTANFPPYRRHGSVLGITQSQYNSLYAKWGGVLSIITDWCDGSTYNVVVQSPGGSCANATAVMMAFAANAWGGQSCWGPTGNQFWCKAVNGCPSSFSGVNIC
ncbi:hypothetical protein HDU84_001877 [Entophlyctis sp. JEL0112]|nr:hypothetical protein HDU84_001877 [Entophlyctis sp. JEL0112]